MQESKWLWKTQVIHRRLCRTVLCLPRTQHIFKIHRFCCFQYYFNRSVWFCTVVQPQSLFSLLSMISMIVWYHNYRKLKKIAMMPTCLVVLVKSLYKNPSEVCRFCFPKINHKTSSSSFSIWNNCSQNWIFWSLQAKHSSILNSRFTDLKNRFVLQVSLSD